MGKGRRLWKASGQGCGATQEKIHGMESHGEGRVDKDHTTLQHQVSEQSWLSERFKNCSFCLCVLSKDCLGLKQRIPSSFPGFKLNSPHPGHGL